MGAPTFGHGAARGYSDVVVPYFVILLLNTTGEIMKQLEPSVANMVGMIILMFIFIGLVDIIDTIGRSKWWNVWYTFGYIFGVFFGFYTLALMGASQDIMAIIGIMLIVVRLVEKIGRKL
ncbi:hypothetical protein [Thermococcus thioreducens]|uniref:Uncharacterized protein n=1 Tax=Thermococcus thioreducens TaxID=277988 RepID=A0A0Q2XPK8_9EURY|nr:hypothetical protein [Thermococcus thioreducens]ASJ13373.1 hypothetical protein A3L14_10995 [Thermococcus thioreducens]KQH83220.1 hypothetical protein AMR53_00615 [Thermococcus thioreducens]SEW23430.1 hypothetical protein SAMN05216170_2307 [Thermococcus thioreducens]